MHAPCVETRRARGSDSSSCPPGPRGELGPRNGLNAQSGCKCYCKGNPVQDKQDKAPVVSCRSAVPPTHRVPSEL
eukprot:scaffold2851_cov114-Isochrysis_galbana.AAC.6